MPEGAVTAVKGTFVEVHDRHRMPMGPADAWAIKQEWQRAAAAEPWSCDPRNAEHRDGGAANVQTTVIDGRRLVTLCAGTEDVAVLVVASTGLGGRAGAPGPRLSFAPDLDATMILLQPVTKMARGPTPHMSSRFSSDRPRVAVVSIGCDASRDGRGDGLGRAEERRGGGRVACLGQHHVRQRARTVEDAPGLHPSAEDHEIVS